MSQRQALAAAAKRERLAATLVKAHGYWPLHLEFMIGQPFQLFVARCKTMATRKTTAREMVEERILSAKGSLIPFYQLKTK